MPDSTMTPPGADPRNRDNLVGFFADRQATAMRHPCPSRPHTLPMDRVARIEAR
ncbi:hypothetical protein [Micromonospora haikouensis]|uniref:hypothetical protein n=1 Tax=Micromonospora haikouensis TaxID=686309 RepID=UPI0037AE7211